MKKYSLLLVVFVVLFGCANPISKFNGNRTGNDVQFIMDYSIMNMTEEHEMELNKDDIIDIVIENESGKISIDIIDSDEILLIKETYTNSKSFELAIPKTSNYKFIVTGDRAKGSISFEKRL